MCGRYSIFSDIFRLAKRFKAVEHEDVKPRYNAAPSQTLPIIWNEGAERKLDFFHWGLIPSWAENPAIGSKMINARAETLVEKPSFRNALKKRRCLVLADGFYEWKAEGKKKQPMRTSLKNCEIFAMAGLWDKWTDKQSGEIIHSFTIITTQANDLLKPIHDRMPAILLPQDEDVWLDKEAETDELLKLLKPYPADALQVEPVSKSLNKAGYDDPSILIPDENEPEDLQLFS